MLGFVVLLIVLGAEVGFMIFSLVTKSYQEEKKNLLRLGSFVLVVLFTLIGVIEFSFRWYMLFIILLIKVLQAVLYFTRRKSRKEKLFRKKHVIMSGIGSTLLVTMAVVPAMIFPQFKPIQNTGKYEVKTVSYTLTDPDRIETFSDKQENRKVTIQFWYPDNVNEKYPLVVFSHGAFGYRGSNRSTCTNLASNGYVVCSIDHTYQSFVTKQTDGKTVIADMKFVNDAMAAQNGAYDEQKTYDLSHEWLKLRMGDMDLVLKDTLAKADADTVYKLIDPEKIGVFGHSLGGATAAEIGRERTDIDAVIVVDGTMIGEEIGLEDGKTLLNTTPYPVPLLNIYNEEHYKDAAQLGNTYANKAAAASAADARELVVKGAGHLNFTDLPVFSPFLAGLLGTGDVDSRYCIKTTNQIILDYFNYYLKGAKELNLQTEY